MRPLAARFSCKVRFQFPESCLRSQRPSTSFPDYYHFHFSFSNTTLTNSYLKLFILIRTKMSLSSPMLTNYYYYDYYFKFHNYGDSSYSYKSKHSTHLVRSILKFSSNLDSTSLSTTIRLIQSTT